MSSATAAFALSLDRMKMFFDIHVNRCDANDPAGCDILHDDSVQYYEELRALRGSDQFIIARRPEPRLHQHASTTCRWRRR